jgi:[ribosomal protein S18]-alanine N-acetyltransferase
VRRKGIGTSLIGRFLQEAASKGVHIVTLEVRRSNFAALEFYNKLGFRPVTIMKGYYNDGEDAYQMQLVL